MVVSVQDGTGALIKQKDVHHYARKLSECGGALQEQRKNSTKDHQPRREVDSTDIKRPSTCLLRLDILQVEAVARHQIRPSNDGHSSQGGSLWQLSCCWSITFEYFVSGG